MRNRFKKILYTAKTSVSRDNGFTLVELMTAVAIISILSSVVLANVSEGNRRQALRRAAQQLTLDIRRAQNLSLAPSDVPNCVYGLKIQSSSDYFLYRVFNTGSPPCALCPAVPTWQSASGACKEKIGSDIAFENSITISNFSPTQDIAFESPEPITYLNGLTGAAPTTVTLQTPQGVTKDVVVNRLGQVEIQ